MTAKEEANVARAATTTATVDSTAPTTTHLSSGHLTTLWRAGTNIRGRVVIGYVALMAAGLSVAIVIARQVHVARVDREIELQLAQEAEELRRLPGETELETGGDVRMLFNEFLNRNVAGDDEAFYTIPIEDGDPGEGIRYSFGAPTEPLDDDAVLRAWATVTVPTTDDFDTDAGDLRSLAVPVVSSGGDVLGVFVVAQYLDTSQNDISELVRLLVLSGLAVLVVSTAVAWWLAGRIVAPVRQLTRTARAITHSDLSARIPVSGRDELAELGTTFNEMVDRLDAGIRAQRQFLDDVAHDLRTPITIARGHLEVLGDEPAERREAIAIVLDELDRMGRSVSDLLVLAKAERPDFLRLQAIDFGDFATDVMHRAAALAPRRWVIDEAPRPGVLAGVGDPDRLMQAVLNLAVNAVDVTSDGDEIGLGIAAVGPTTSGDVRLWIRDSGPGIAADGTDLFQRYQQGSGEGGDGIGLGLAIVAAVARAHGGVASHTPTFGGGATFSIEIPLEPK